MAKTIANLTNEEMIIVTDYVELFGITEEEALSQAISEGSISDSVGGNFKYKPEGFNELKFYKVDPKSAMYKLNKELKKTKKDELFEDETFYYNTVISKTEDKKGFDLDKCSTVKVGERGQIVIPKQIRDELGINAGDNLIVLGNKEEGIQIILANSLEELAETIINGNKK